MKKFYLVVLTFLTLGIFLGFSNSDNPKKMSFDYSGIAPGETYQPVSNPNQTDAVYYSDNFDQLNDTTSLKARGYLIYYRGSGPQGVGSTWFQPSGVFNAFNGPPLSYVGANYQVVTGINDIDSWLILPDLDVVAGDIIRFRCRSATGNPFPDSVRVMYNSQGGITPESAGWIELGRFLAQDDGTWELKSFTAVTGGFSARFAIRYCVADGGPSGANSNYIGIDALEVDGQGVLPVELASFVSVINNNNVTLNWSTATETNNSGFDIERSNVRGQTSDEWVKIANVTGNGTSTVGHSYSFTDKNLSSGNYNYRLKQIDFNGNFEYFNLSNEVIIGVPAKFELSQNYPNPFNPSTKIEYQLSNDGNVNISVFDNAGKEVASLVNEFKAAGYYTVNFNAASLSSGVYFYKISSGNFTSVKKMMLLK